MTFILCELFALWSIFSMSACFHYLNCNKKERDSNLLSINYWKQSDTLSSLSLLKYTLLLIVSSVGITFALSVYFLLMTLVFMVKLIKTNDSNEAFAYIKTL
jgi:hypothetical protein